VTVPLLIASGYMLFAIRAQLPMPPDSSGGKARSTSERKTTQLDPWLVSMIDWYYPRKSSEQWEELFIRDFFRDQKGGVFLDVGASDYRDASLTYYLDRHLGWSGVAIDAIEHYRADYEKYRPRTRFFRFYVSDKDDDKADFYVVRNDERKSTGVLEAEELHKNDGLAIDKTEVPTITLNTLLTKAGVEKIDLMNMDIELAEVVALRGFDIARFAPKLVVIEAHAPVKTFVLEYFAKAGYEQIEPYADHDIRNFYFVPKAVHEEWKQRKAPWDEINEQFPPGKATAQLDAAHADVKPGAAP
jgi:FkbM family methyltransferase